MGVAVLVGDESTDRLASGVGFELNGVGSVAVHDRRLKRDLLAVFAGHRELDTVGEHSAVELAVGAEIECVGKSSIHHDDIRQHDLWRGGVLAQL